MAEKNQQEIIAISYGVKNGENEPIFYGIIKEGDEWKSPKLVGLTDLDKETMTTIISQATLAQDVLFKTQGGKRSSFQSKKRKPKAKKSKRKY